MKGLPIIKKYINYYTNAKTVFNVHSPFVFEFMEDVLEDKRKYYFFDDVKPLRESMLNYSREIEVTDLGAGSRTGGGKRRKVSDIAKSAVSPAWQAELLFKIINKYKPNTILEMGTSLGITTLYQKAPNHNARLITLEGCPNIAKIAKKNFRTLGITGLDLRVGPFSETLPGALKDLQQIDYAFIDGHHAQKPTLDYFQQILPFTHTESILIFDDIHWSDGMELAWKEIQEHPQVTLSIDLFYFGLVFFRDTFARKQHFTLTRAKNKPWKMGFFKP